MNRRFRIANIVETSSLKSNTWYHGTNRDFIAFTDEFVGMGTDQEGPGIYFTNSYNDARHYGIRVFEVRLNLRKRIPNTGAVDPQEILKLMRAAPDYEDTLTNWGYDEDTLRNEKIALNAMIKYNETPIGVFQQVWYDFYRDYPIEYLRQMVKLGYDGFVVDRDSGIKHAIVYNPNIIEYSRFKHD